MALYFFDVLCFSPFFIIFAFLFSFSWDKGKCHSDPICADPVRNFKTLKRLDTLQDALRFAAEIDPFILLGLVTDYIFDSGEYCPHQDDYKLKS